MAEHCRTELHHVRAVVAALAARMEAVQKAASETAPQYVRNDRTKVVHRILVGDPGVPPMHWMTHCPWKFGLAAHATRCEAPEEEDAICRSCFPEIAAKRRSGAESSGDALSDRSL